MREKLEEISQKSKEKIEQIKNSQELNDLKVRVLGKKGELTLHLFDLNKDPSEKTNLSVQKPELVERLNKEITRWSKSVYSEVPDQFAKKVRSTNK